RHHAEVETDPIEVCLARIQRRLREMRVVYGIRKGLRLERDAGIGLVLADWRLTGDAVKVATNIKLESWLVRRHPEVAAVNRVGKNDNFAHTAALERPIVVVADAAGQMTVARMTT